ncbi:uncharacterized protein N7483_013107 [Penicillium malachiteum]|uniref:uncharacterized protein n=1 Tax=Penicillium malachiteum TaxID=1324776 RepID=UPI00254837F7|nr:uncharacterized protein N7483_013107 [Penicillium malachiteum]KAJ5715926.1 hypothetical protein N7483_013107 [Penicillium malachiteum]
MFRDASPIPYILQPEERIENLKDFLETDFGELQRVNVEALIRLYESGELGPRKQTDPPTVQPIVQQTTQQGIQKTIEQAIQQAVSQAVLQPKQRLKTRISE